MRCTLVLPFGVRGGSEAWATTMLRHLPEVTVEALILEHGPLADDLADLGIPTRVLPVGRSPLDIVVAVPKVRRLLKRQRPDVVWANGVKAAAVALPAAKLTRTPSVWVKHDFSFDRQLARPLGRMADRVVGTSAALVRSSGRGDGTVVPPARPTLEVVPAEDSRAWWEERLGPLPGRWAVTVGRLVPYKGVDVAIRAVALGDWGLVVVGEDDRATPGERDRLERLAADLGVSDRVRFAGAVPEAGRRLAGFDAALVLTRTDESGFGREGFSIVALEAAAAGLPLVGAADSEEVARIAGELGVAVDPTDATAVARALNEIAAPHVGAHARARGPKLVAEHPDAEGCARALRDVLVHASMATPGSTT